MMLARKRLLINPAFQLRFLAYLIGIALFICGIFFVAERYFFWNLTRRGTELGLAPDHVFFVFIKEQQTVMDMIFLSTAGISILILGVFGLYVSNRVAGPLYRMKRYFEGAGLEGGLGTVSLKFRKGDYFQDLADAVNNYFKKQKSNL